MPELLSIQGPFASGMITMRCDLGGVPLKRALKTACSGEVPGRGEICTFGDTRIAWMSPDELLLLVPEGSAERIVLSLRKSLSGQHHLVEDVSGMRNLFRISGAGVQDVLAQGAPVDLALFRPGMIRRTRIGLLAAAFWMTAPDSFEIVCFRSVSGHLGAWLHNAAQSGNLAALPQRPATGS